MTDLMQIVEFGNQTGADPIRWDGHTSQYLVPATNRTRILDREHANGPHTRRGWLAHLRPRPRTALQHPHLALDPHPLGNGAAFGNTGVDVTTCLLRVALTPTMWVLGRLLRHWTPLPYPEPVAAQPENRSVGGRMRATPTGADTPSRGLTTTPTEPTEGRG